MESHRYSGYKHVSLIDGPDNTFGEKIRFSSESASDHQVVAGIDLQLFTLGIPCIYYGTEQAFAGPEPAARRWLAQWKSSDLATCEKQCSVQSTRVRRDVLDFHHHQRVSTPACRVLAPSGRLVIIALMKAARLFGELQL